LRSHHRLSRIAILLFVITCSPSTTLFAQDTSKGVYALGDAVDFNVLDSVVIDLPTGRITLVGHRDARYGGPPIPYLDHLAELLKHPAPEFSLNWTPESEPRVEALFRNFDSEEYVKGLAAQWAEIMDADGHPTGQGRWLLPLVGVKPTSSGGRLGRFGAEVQEVSNGLEIVSVEPYAAADRAGISPGDILHNYANAAEFSHSVRLLGEGGTLMLQIRRNGTVGSPENIILDGEPGDPWAELDKFDIVEKMLWAAGNNKAAMLIHSLAEVQRIVRGSGAGFQTAFSILVAVADDNDPYWQDMAEYQAGRMSKDTLLEHAFRAIFSAMETACAFDDLPLTSAFDNARGTGAASSDAFDQTLLVLNERIKPFLEGVMQSLLAKHEEIQLPPEVLASTIGPAVEVEPEYRGVDPHSALARVFYSADYLGKSLINMPSLQQKIPRYESDFAFERNHPDKVGAWHETGNYHLWFSIDSLDLAQSKDGNTLLTRDAKIRVNIREKAPREGDLPAVPGGYEELLTSLYDEFAVEFPVLHELREAAKIAAAADWLKAKRPNVTLPDAGRIVWDGQDRAPGFLYLTWSPQERPGRLAMALSAMGGIDFEVKAPKDRILVTAPKDIVGVADDMSTPVVDLSPIAKALNLPAETPVPQPVGWVTKETHEGQEVTAVSFIPPADPAEAPASVEVQQHAGDKALILWKANDLEGAKSALMDEVQNASDPRAKANAMMMLAQILHESGDDAEAVNKLNEALQLDPKNPLLDLLIAKEKYDTGDQAGAEEVLKKYVALHPENPAAAKLLADLQRPPADGTTASTPAGTAPFSRPLQEAAGVSTDGISEALKAHSDLQDHRIDPYKLHGMAPAPSVPQGLAETPEWRQAQAKREALQQASSGLDAQLKEIRAKKARKEGNPSELETLESQLQQRQAGVKNAKDAIEKKMANDIVQWNEGRPQPSTDANGKDRKP